MGSQFLFSTMGFLTISINVEKGINALRSTLGFRCVSTSQQIYWEVGFLLFWLSHWDRNTTLYWCFVWVWFLHSVLFSLRISRKNREEIKKKRNRILFYQKGKNRKKFLKVCSVKNKRKYLGAYSFVLDFQELSLLLFLVNFLFYSIDIFLRGKKKKWITWLSLP